MTTLRHRWTLSACMSSTALVGLIGIAAPASAQQIAPNAVRGATPADTSTGIAEIVVTARKTAENIQKAPLAITAFSGTDIVQKQITGLRDLSKYTPGLRFDAASYDTFATYVTIRGVTATDVLLVSEPAVGIYVDGIYQGTTQATGLGDIYDVDRIEVLKGPQGTLYGRNSTGGAVSVYTALPSYSGYGGKIRFGYGNYDTVQGAGEVNIPLLADKAALRLVGQSFYRADGFGRDVTNDRPLDTLQSESFRGALRLDPTNRLDVVIRADYTHAFSTGKIAKLVGVQNPLPVAVAASAGFQLGLISSFSDLFTKPGIFDTIRNAILADVPPGTYDAAYSQGANYENKLDAYGQSATISYNLSDAATIKSITGYRRLTKYFPADPDASPLRLVDPLQTTLDVKQVTQELQLTGALFENRLKYVLGGYFYNSSGHDGAVVNALAPINPTNPNITDATVDDTSYAGYAQATYTIIRGLNITGGVRYTDETKTLTSRNRNAAGCQVPPVNLPPSGECIGVFNSPFTNVSYTASVDYQVTPETLLYFRTSKGFKAGGVNERGTSAAGTFAPFGPETLVDYELGLKTDLFDRRLRVDSALFTSTYSGIQQTVVVSGPGGNPISIIANTGKARIDGGELEVIAKPVPELVMRGSYALTAARITQGFQAGNSDNLIQGVARNQASGSFVYTLPTSFGNVQGGLSYSYQSRVDFQPSNHLVGGAAVGVPASLSQQAPYGLLDGRIAMHVDKGDFDVAIYGRNLTNKYYIAGALDLSSSGLGIVVAYPGDPRTFGFEVSKKF